MPKLADISQHIRDTASAWAALASERSWANDREAEEAKFRRALLHVAIAVLSSDGPLNAYETLLLAELFGMDDEIERAEVKAAMGRALLTEAFPVLTRAVQGFAFASPDYRPDADPVIGLLDAILDAGLAADKFPSEAEAWASSRVMTKLRQVALREPADLASVSLATLDLRDVVRRDPPAAERRPTPPRPAEQPPVRHDSEPVVPSGSAVNRTRVESGSRSKDRPARDKTIRELLTELNALVGLEDVKEQVETLVNLAKVRALRTARGLPSPNISQHLVFSGNPGTGKTTVARILGQIYGQLGLLSVGKCIEVDRTQLIGQYLGQTTTKTAELLAHSLGSVLFLDEAYSLTDGDASDYGDEAISVLLKFMEDHRDDFVVIVAGYTDKMTDFLGSNPGLGSRFSRTIAFPDYAPDELAEIFRRMCASDGFTLERGAEPRLQAAVEALLNPRPAHFANAREVRKIYERAIERQANRLAHMSCSDDDLALLRVEDIPPPAGPRA